QYEPGSCFARACRCLLREMHRGIFRTMFAAAASMTGLMNRERNSSLGFLSAITAIEQIHRMVNWQFLLLLLCFFRNLQNTACISGNDGIDAGRQDVLQLPPAKLLGHFRLG